MALQAGNRLYRGEADLPGIVPVFPLSGALLLPGGQMPLNIFEPRYVAMIDAAMAGDRVIGMIQPSPDMMPARASHDFDPPLAAVGALGRLTSVTETGDGRYLVTLTGISRFRVIEEIKTRTLFRQCRIQPFVGDLAEADDGPKVNRPALLAAFRAYLDAHQLDADWDSINQTPNHTLVNALSMIGPFGPPEKQALLEASDLKTRAETLIAITEVLLAREKAGPKPMLQ